jgi:hypothetical protein
MSYQSITASTLDKALQDRVTAAALKEAIAGGDEFSETSFAEQLQRNPILALNYFMWPTAIDNEDAYEYAVETGNQNPGGDVGVISDANLQSVVQTYWPPDAVNLPSALAPVIPPPPEEPEA